MPGFSKPISYLSLAEVLEMQSQLIQCYGGLPGLREPGALEAAILRPQMGYYTDLIQQAAALMESLAMNHPFIDGNKRIAFAATDAFLNLNGLSLQVDAIETHQTFMQWFEHNTFCFATIESWLRQHLEA